MTSLTVLRDENNTSHMEDEVAIDDTSGKLRLTNSDKGSVNIDQLLEEVVKPCGLWQWTVALLLLISTSSPTTFPVYANSASPHRCRMEDKVEDFIKKHNIPFTDVASRIDPWYMKNVTWPTIGSLKKGCYRYNLKWNNTGLKSILLVKNASLTSYDDVEPCPYGYLHEVSSRHYPHSVVAEYELLCSRSWLLPLGTSSYLCGMSIGFMVGGRCGDLIGRRNTMILFTCVEIIGGICTSLSPNYISYVIARSIIAFGSSAKITVAGVLVIELTTARHRSMFKAVSTIGITFVYRAVLALWAYLIPDWRWLNVAVMSPVLLAVLYFPFLPESPRWLMSKNRTEQSFAVLKRGCVINHLGKGPTIGRDKIRQLDWEFHKADSSHKNSVPVCKDTQGRRNRGHSRLTDFKITALSTLIMFGSSLSYIGILFYATAVRDYIYLTGFYNSLAAIPGTVIFFLLYRYFRRRKLPLMVLLLISCCILFGSSIYSIFGKPATDVVHTICSNLVLVLFASSSCMLFLYIPELFPTSVRSQRTGVILGLSRIGTMLCAFINELDVYFVHGFPILVYSAAVAMVIILLLFLPDTTGDNLPDK
ncbi:unnamed protein product [Calicophoron daubneyi]|uniref:Major facilitator superfamily (MFS) profile domain-containing protein n=1 Tax=Calicophoron daubneyi TaxID=300641 RepID=A0AAV2TR72_CALDB